LSQWQALVTAGLIGSERAVVPPVESCGASSAQAVTPEDPAAVLLARAALLTAARRAGRRPGRAEPPPEAEPDDRPLMSRDAGRRLARLLNGDHQELLGEWLAAAATRDLRPPAQLLPALLDRARHSPGPGASAYPLRRLVAEVGGRRARWLARLNPDWQYLLAGTAGHDAWRTGTTGERREYLAALRARDPAAARELIAGGWDRAGAADRAMFLSVLDGRSVRPEPGDEPLLEAALDDRADEVRRQAADLLARMPGSALGRRMAERAAGIVRLEHGGGRPRLAVLPPAEADAAMLRDGIGAGHAPARSRLAWTRAGEIIARTPLVTWTEAFGLPVARIVLLPAGDWTPVLFASWSRAAVAQQDQEWMAVLLAAALAGQRPGAGAEAAALRQLARHADPRLGRPAMMTALGPQVPAALRDAVGVLRFRYEMLKELGYDHGDG
jgi:hypothetical protein